MIKNTIMKILDISSSETIRIFKPLKNIKKDIKEKVYY
ncbi:hypothetical protein SAMN04488528_1006119 [Clostridium frigidicarnis]|uniref:Uncharacterized protein n=1 Tax=Clostridium frigidicarnis TaxID=84698 RepID=A0A1I0WWB1_9CLOT|nr:hypothetical protein SAMN04488528_1006119 [Clostridium frigidicarnis]